MHMADALLSPAVGGVFWAATAATTAYAAKKLRQEENEKLIPLMGVLGAFVFAAQMINFTIPGTGSSGHIGGGMLLAILLGPNAAFIVIASVLTVQALFFADGGLLALGANIWNLGFYPSYIAYPFIYKAIVKDNPTPKKITLASVLSVVAALQLGAFSVVLQTKLSGISELPFKNFLMLMQPIHLAIGIAEGFITAGVVNYIRSIQPEIIEKKTTVSYKKAVIALSIMAVITGGLLSWFASTHPDGLEWSIMNVYGEPELEQKDNPIVNKLQSIQEKTAILPDYSLPEPEATTEEAAEGWPNPDPGTSLSGILGGLIVLLVVAAFGMGLRRFSRSGNSQ